VFATKAQQISRQSLKNSRQLIGICVTPRSAHLLLHKAQYALIWRKLLCGLSCPFRFRTTQAQPHRFDTLKLQHQIPLDALRRKYPASCLTQPYPAWLSPIYILWMAFRYSSMQSFGLCIYLGTYSTRQLILSEGPFYTKTRVVYFRKY
jgi:polyferredoxin